MPHSELDINGHEARDSNSHSKSGCARRKKGLTQTELGDLLNVAQSYVARYEKGNTDIGISRLVEIARILDHEIVLVPRHKLPVVEWTLDERNSDSESRPAYVPDEDEDGEDTPSLR